MSTSDLDRALHASVLKREAVKEQRFREEKAKHEEEVQLGFGATEMSKEELRKVIDSDRRLYYRTEELNDKLYIHYKGWKKLQNLEGWTGLRALYAECNAFDTIEGLDFCRNLKSLFLQENCIRKISGLENCPLLWNLNLSNNFIERLEGLAHLKSLNTLTIAKNKIGLKGVSDVVELVGTNISCLDLQDNRIWDADVLPEVFMRMPELRVLYLKGNPCQRKIPNYRKSTTVYVPTLTYLDDRPVFPDDRRAAEAFNRGGLEEERAERRRIREESNAKHEQNMRAFSEMVESAKREKRERTEMRAEDKYTDETDPVESNDKRMQRLVDKWREENEDDLKDDAKEHAECMLKAEREPREVPSSPSQSHQVAEEPEPEQAVDHRKLVYEDIWADTPLPKKSSQAQAESMDPGATAAPRTDPEPSGLHELD